MFEFDFFIGLHKKGGFMKDVHYWMDLMCMSRVREVKDFEITVAKFKLVTVQHILSSC